MGLEKNVAKLDKYFERLESGKAEKIKPSHVEKVIAKLNAKKDLLLSDLDETVKASKIERIKGKLATAEEQLKRANWLLEQISKA